MATTTDRPHGAGGVRRERLRLLLRQEEAMLRNRRQVLRDGLPTWMSGVMDDEERSLDAEGGVWVSRCWSSRPERCRGSRLPSSA
jgi:hypothetical protein